MRVAPLLLVLPAVMTLSLPAASVTTSAQQARGSISGRILMNGVVDRNNSYAILVLPADISQPVDTAQVLSDLIDVGGEFTVSGVDDGEYLVVLASTHIDPAVPEETVRFSNETVLPMVPAAPRKFTRAAVRVTIENGRADRDVVFELESPFAQDKSTAAAELPATGLRPPIGRSPAPYLPTALSALGLLAFVTGLHLRPRTSHRR